MNIDAVKKWEGRVVDGGFTLRQWLGGSDHSAVFVTERAAQVPQKTAIKLIPAGTVDSNLQLIRWRTAVQLSHPHLIRLFEMGRCEMDGEPYLYVVMELADEDLSQILPSRPLAPAEMSELLPPVLEGISYLHRQGFVHTRIKPSNILALKDQVKLSADGLLTIGESGDKISPLSVYDAPEAATKATSPPADVWSLGVTLVTALTQHPPMNGGVKRDLTIPETITEPFRTIARECLRKEPNQRCTIAEIESRLRGDAIPVPIIPEIPSSSYRSHTKPSMWRWAVPALIALVLAVALLGSKFLHHQSESPATQTQDQAAQPLPQMVPVIQTPAAVSTPIRAAKKSSSANGEVQRKVLPDVSSGARRTITGKIKISALVNVDTSGKVTAVKLTSNPSGSKYFANEVLTAARRWEFTAPQVNGEAVASNWMLHFQFSRTSTQATPTRVAGH